MVELWGYGSFDMRAKLKIDELRATKSSKSIVFSGGEDPGSEGQ